MTELEALAAGAIASVKPEKNFAPATDSAVAIESDRCNYSVSADLA
ncbi:hypothetical protein [Synechococcus sp. PCC 7336]|nr:hypothetical protein [Synechococcus sp. PCC 7336]